MPDSTPYAAVAAISVSFGSPADFGKLETVQTLQFDAFVATLTAAPWHAGKFTLAEYLARAQGSKADKDAAKADKATRWFSLARVVSIARCAPSPDL